MVNSQHQNHQSSGKSMNPKSQSYNLLLNVWTCRKRWSCPLCPLHSHWKIQLLSPPFLSDQDQGWIYLTSKLKTILLTLSWWYHLNHGIDTCVFLFLSDHTALVLITTTICKHKITSETTIIYEPKFNLHYSGVKHKPDKKGYPALKEETGVWIERPC